MLITYLSTFKALINSSGSGGSLTGVFGDKVTCNSLVPSTSTTTSLSFFMPLFWDFIFFDLWLCECFTFLVGGSSSVGFVSFSLPKKKNSNYSNWLIVDYSNVIKIIYQKHP